MANVLVACEFSGVVRDEFIKKGHNAWSCDLVPSDKPGPHMLGDVRNVLDFSWDLVIAHPPCTRLCNSGVRWLAERNLWGDMKVGAEFFKMFLDLDCPVAVENPVMHKYAVSIIGRKHDFTVQPWQFGHPESKRTCFWTKDLPKLKPTNILTKPPTGWQNQTPSGQNKLGPSVDRARLRSVTYQGVAEAMADQWG